jgi:hypothetical protein
MMYERGFPNRSSGLACGANDIFDGVDCQRFVAEGVATEPEDSVQLQFNGFLESRVQPFAWIGMSSPDLIDIYPPEVRGTDCSLIQS